jgi:hypothetical protein
MLNFYGTYTKQEKNQGLLRSPRIEKMEFFKFRLRKE